MAQVTLIRLEGVEGASVAMAIDNANELCDDMGIAVAMEPEAVYGFVSALMDTLKTRGFRLRDSVEIITP